MNPLVERLGWVLVHSMWQFALVALLAGVIARAMRRSSSAARYGVHVVAMGVTVVVPLVTWMISLDDSSSRAASAPGYDPVVVISPEADATRLADNSMASAEERGVGSTFFRNSPKVDLPTSETDVGEFRKNVDPTPQREASWSQRTKTALQPWLAWIVVVWSLGVLVCSLRPLLGWHMLWRLKRVGVSPVSNDVLATMRRVSEQFRLRRAVSVLQSTLAQVPVVVGYLRPVVLLPVSLITSLPAEQLEAILAHELAHVRRHDFVVNLLQTLIETFFFYHPAVWWLSHQIRVEREHCCDDLVVASFGNRVEYGRALLAIEELRGRSTVLALGVADGSLLSRVRRIVSSNADKKSVPPGSRWLACLLTLGLVLIIGFGTFVSSRAEVESPSRESGTADEDLRRAQASTLKPIEGEVIDAATGKPIEGATVRFRFRKMPVAFRGNDKPLAELVFRNVGRFTFELPDAVKGETELFVESFGEHPDYQSWGAVGHGFYLRPNGGPNPSHDLIRQVKLAPGKVVTGQVLDLNGRPANGIAVTSGRSPEGWQNGFHHKTTTDANGRYRMVVPPGNGGGRIYVIPNHAAAVSRAITPEFGEQPVFQLLRGTRFFGRVTDAKGRGVAGIVVRAIGSNRVPNRTAMTDADGKYSLPPCQYGKYVVELYDEGRFPELPKDGMRLPDVYLHQVVDLPKTAPTEQQLDFKPTESVRMTARYTTSDDQPVSGRSLAVSGVAGKVNWWGRLREVTDQPGLQELRVPRGFEGRIDQNADVGGFLRILRDDPDSKPTSPWSTARFDKDGVSFHIRSLKASSITLRATHDGQPVKIAGSVSTPQFANQKAADEAGARLPSAQFRQVGLGQLWFDAHPNIDLLLKLDVPGFKSWQETVRIAEGEDRVIDVALESNKPADTQSNGESPQPADPPNAGTPNPNTDLNRTPATENGGRAQSPRVGARDIDFDDDGRVKPEPIDDEAVRLRAVGQKFFLLADYVSMAAAYAQLSDRASATVDDHLWHGHAHQLARNWPAAVRAYHGALIKLDAQIAETDVKLKPLEEKVKLDESFKLLIGNPYLPLKRDQEQLPKRWPDLVLLIGHLELVELKNPAAAAKTLSRGLRYAPELAVPLAELLAKAEAAGKAKPDYLRGMQFIDPLETQRYLAMAQEQLNQPAVALDTWSRVRLGKLVFPSSYATTEPAHLKELASKLPQDSLQPHHRFVLKTPDRERLTPREAKDFLKVSPANPFKATPLPGVELTKIGPSANSLVQLPDGRLLMAFASGDQHHIGIKFSSSKNGTDWDAPWEFAHNSVFDTRAPSLLVDDDGEIWMLCLSKRLTTERFASGPYELWLTHSRDGRDWSPLRSLQIGSESDLPRIATAQYQELAQLTRVPDRRFGIFHAGHFGAATSPGLLTTLSPLPLPIDKQQHVNNPHATFDSDGRCHLVFDDFGRGLFYSRSNDLREWSPPQKLGVPEKNSSVSRPQLLLADGRVALIHERNNGTWLQRGTIDANGLQLGEATQVTDHLMPLNGSRLLRVGDRVLISAGTPPYVSNLLSAPVTKLLAPKDGPAEIAPP